MSRPIWSVPSQKLQAGRLAEGSYDGVRVVGRDDRRQHGGKADHAQQDQAGDAQMVVFEAPPDRLLE